MTFAINQHSVVSFKVLCEPRIISWPTTRWKNSIVLCIALETWILCFLGKGVLRINQQPSSIHTQTRIVSECECSCLVVVVFVISHFSSFPPFYVMNLRREWRNRDIFSAWKYLSCCKEQSYVPSQHGADDSTKVQGAFESKLVDLRSDVRSCDAIRGHQSSENRDFT